MARPDTKHRDGDWPCGPALIHPQTVKAVVRRVAFRRRLRRDEADELHSQLWIKLLEDNCRRLRQFRGRSSLAHYLARIADRLVMDQRSANLGKWRASRAASAHGPAAVMFERLVQRDGQPRDVAAIYVRETHGVTITVGVDACPPGHSPGGRLRRHVELESLGDLADQATPAPDEIVIAQEQQRVAVRVRRALRAAVGALGAPERQLLRRRYVHGERVSDLAREAGMPQRALYTEYERIVSRLRRDLAAHGVRGADASMATNAGR